MSEKSTINWKDELDRIANGEEILAINIGGDLYHVEKLDAAFKRLEHEFDHTGGLPEGEPFWAWTETSVYFCATHGGVEWLEKIPRNPQSGTPLHIGGY